MRHTSHRHGVLQGCARYSKSPVDRGTGFGAPSTRRTGNRNLNVRRNGDRSPSLVRLIAYSISVGRSKRVHPFHSCNDMGVCPMVQSRPGSSGYGRTHFHVIHRITHRGAPRPREVRIMGSQHKRDNQAQSGRLRRASVVRRAARRAERPSRFRAEVPATLRDRTRRDSPARPEYRANSRRQPVHDEPARLFPR